MIAPALPFNEAKRLEVLNQYNLLDTLPEEDFDNITYLASMVCQTPISLITIIDENRQFFKSHLGLDISEAGRDVSFCGHTINCPRDLFEIEDARVDERFHNNPLVTGYPNVVFYAGIPLVTTDGFALGTLCVVDNKPKRLDHAQKEALKKLAKQVMFLLESREKKIMEDGLKLANFTFKNASIPMYYVKEDASFYDVNDIGCSKLGYSKTELLALKVSDLDKDYDENRWPMHWAELKAKGKLTVETQQKKKDGSLIDVVITANFVKFGNLEINCAYVLDISEKKKTDKQLHLVEYAFRNATIPMHFLRKDGTIYNFNEVASSLFGYTNEEYSKITIFDLSLSHNSKSWADKFNELKNGINQPYITPHKRKDFSIVFLEVRPKIIVFENMELCFVSMIDVTDRLKAEQDIKHSNERYENATIATSEVVWEYIVNNNSHYYSQNFTRLFGHPISGLEYGQNDSRKRNLHPEDADWVLENDKKVIEGLQDKWEIEYRLKKADGQYAIVLDRGFSIKNSTGKVERLVGAIQDITKRRETEEKLRLIDFSLRNTATPMTFIKEDGSFYDFNDATCNLLGYTRDEYKNLTILDINPFFNSEKWAQRWQDIQAKGGVPYYTILQKKDGTLLDIEERGNIIQYGGLEISCATIIDITEKKKAEEELKRSNLRYHYATLATSDVIWESDLIKKETYISKNFTTFFGHPLPDGIMPQGINVFRQNIHPDDADTILENQLATVSSDAHGNKWEGEYRLKKADGTYATVLDRTFAIKDGNGTVIGLVGAVHDMTKQKEAEKEKELLLQELIRNNKELTQFSYITTHNLRSPLTNLIAICRLINTDKIPDPFTVKMIESFKKSTKLLDETLNDLINILIIKENTHLPLSKLFFQDIMDKIEASLSHKLINEKVTIEADFSEAQSVSFSNIYLESTFLNLLTNSIKYRHPDRAPVIKIKSKKDKDNSTIVAFTDNGMGMNMERVKKNIFGLYKRFHTNSDGKGIGLYLIHSQITALGGKIEVDSTENVGTTFTITFK